MTTNSKVPLSKEAKDAAIATLREFHADTMKKFSPNKAYFFPKVPYSGHNGVRVVGLFRSELEKEGEDVFIELISMKYETLDPKRTLYRHRFNPHFREEYELAPGNNERYSVPIDELEIVWKLPEVQAREITVDIDNLDDCNISQLTARDVVALFIKKPVSSKPWLNELINLR